MLKFKIILKFILLLFTHLLFAQDILDKTQENYIWDLSSLYSNDLEWDKEYKTLTEEIEKFKLSDYEIDNIDDLALLFDKAREMRVKASSLAIYGILMSNLDYESQLAESQNYQGLRIDNETEKILSPVKSIILNIDRSKLDSLIMSDLRFKVHETRINRILMENKKTLPQELDEVLISYYGRIQHSGDNYNALFNSDLNWPKIIYQNDTIQLSSSSYFQYRREPISEKKTKIMEMYFDVLSKHDDLFANFLSQRIYTEYIVAKHRGFTSGAEANFFIRDGMPENVLSVMNEVTLENKDIAKRYLKLKKRLLNVDKLSMFDLYVPAYQSNKNYSVKESIKSAYRIFGELDSSLKSKIIDILKGNTFHLAATENKNMMWGAYPPVGDNKPFTIMYHNNDFGSSNRIMRALMLNIVYNNIPKEKISDTRDDPPIYNNGIIYFGDILHYDHHIRNAPTDEIKLSLLTDALDRIWITFYRYAIAAQFERNIENLMKNGEKISGTRMTELFRESISNISGDDLFITNAESREWMTSTQSFYTYEHLYWAPAMAVGCYIQEKYLEGDDAIKRILGDVYNTAQTDRSYHLLKEADIDMTENDVYQSVMRRMTDLMDQIERIH
jgi:oligoendopeptidase F